MFIFSQESVVESLQINATINPKKLEKISSKDFEMRKVLGKGGYGKVFQVYYM